MKKKYFKIITWCSLFVIVMLIDLYVNHEKKEPMIEVLAYNNVLTYGSEIQLKELSFVSINPEAFMSYMVTDDEQILGMYTTQNSFQNEFVSSLTLSKEKPFLLKSTQRLITVKCTTVESNGWSSEANDVVDLVMVQKEKVDVLENVVLKRRFDENNDENLLGFYTFVVTEAQAMLYYKNVSLSDVYVLIK